MIELIPHEVEYDYAYCKRCNRKIYDELSIDRGYGPKCYEKVQADKEEKELIGNDEVK